MWALEDLFWRLRRRPASTARATPVAAEAATTEAPAAPPAPVLLEVEGISKAFIGLQALSDVSFDVAAPELLLLDQPPPISGPDYAVETVYTGPLGRYTREERTPVPRTPTKPYNCSVVSETVSISLRRRQSLGGHGKLFVRCSETECQYIDTNEPPCPLTLQLFEAEIAERMAQRTE